MFSLNKQLKAAQARSRGFTIVELLIVIVVIGILATLVIVTFSGIQQKGRNSQRQTDINAIASHVEAFNASKGYYPSAADLNSSSVRAAEFKGLDPEALKDPKATSADVNATAASNTQYGYVATGCTNTDVTSDTNQCTGYTLTANLEGGASPYQKKSN